MGRRTFVKGIGATALVTTGLASTATPAAAVDWGLAASYAVGGPVGALAYGSFIAGPDEEEVAEALDWQTHVNEYTRAREDQLMLDQTLASLERDVQLVDNKAREEAIFRIYEQGVDSGSESDATDSAEEAIDEAYATVEKSILTSWNIRANRAKTLLEEHSSIIKAYAGDDDAGDWGTSSGYDMEDPGDALWSVNDETLLNGETVEITGTTSESSGDAYINTPLDIVPDKESTHSDRMKIPKPDPADYDVSDVEAPEGQSQETVSNAVQWGEILIDLYDGHDAMIDEVSSMVDTYYQPAVDGDIDLHDAVGPKHLTDTASTASDYQEAAMALRGMGYPISKEVVTISLPTEDDGTLELTGRLAWTAHNGDTLPVGEEIVPEDTVGSVMAAVNVPDGVETVTGNETNTTDTDDTDGPGAETLELTGPFVIESAEGASEVTFEDRTLVEADSDLTNEEIQAIFAENFEANEEATENVHDTATGGGGGWSGLSTTDKGIVAIVAAAILGLVTR